MSETFACSLGSEDVRPLYDDILNRIQSNFFFLMNKYFKVRNAGSIDQVEDGKSFDCKKHNSNINSAVVVYKESLKSILSLLARAITFFSLSNNIRAFFTLQQQQQKQHHLKAHLHLCFRYYFIEYT